MRVPACIHAAVMRTSLAFLCLHATGLMVTIEAAEVSFRNDVMAVLSKAGCNLGSCHGNARGKGGFQLSLRGQDWQNDFLVLTRDWQGRRTNTAEPDRSLLLLKPTMQLAHEGGQRFSQDSEEYALLRRWIAAGLPADPPLQRHLTGLDVSPTRILLKAPHWSAPLQVRAHFSDGSMEPLERFAVYEVGTPIVDVSKTGEIQATAVGETVVLVRYLDQQVAVRVAIRPENASFTWEAPPAHGMVDEQVFAKLRELEMLPSAICDDPTFLRRTTLDLIGLLPTEEEARRFAADTSPAKRDRWIDQLLERPEFADWWALKWADMLRVEEKTLDAKGAAAFHGWLRAAFATDQPLDELVRELLTAQGSTYSEPAANFYRALRDPLARSEAVGQLFLGVRLQCARCHNHPFDRWTQDDYYAWGNVLSRIDYKIVENKRRDDNDKHEFDGEQIVFWSNKGDVNDPRTGQPRRAQLLGASVLPPSDDRQRPARLAAWLTSPENDRFAEMLVNRVWRHLMGRGLVEPVDDFRATNPPTHPELLKLLAQDLRSNGYQLKHLLRTIARSQTYQLSAEPNATNSDDELNYSHAIARRLTAEQLSDAISQATQVDIPYRGYPLGTRATELAGVGAMLRRMGGPQAGDEWLRVNGRPQRLQSCECERSDETTLAQTFQLISSELMQKEVTTPGNRAARAAAMPSIPEGIESLYWACLSRPPTAAEQGELTKYVEHQPERLAAFQDLLWSLMTSHEFLLRR